MAHWDSTYREKNMADATVAQVLLNNKRLLPSSGVALDYASGLAANAVFLAELGIESEAWDGSEVAVNKINAYANAHALKLKATQFDLEKNPPKISNKFDVIVVSHFLYRDNLMDLYDYLKKDGLLLYQTFSGKQLNNNGPARDAFRLQRGELLKVFSKMQLLYYREDRLQAQHQDNQSDIVQFVAMK